MLGGNVEPSDVGVVESSGFSDEKVLGCSVEPSDVGVVESS